MHYFGGKNSFSKELAAILSPIAQEQGCFVEPFIGGASVMVAVNAPRRIAGDANPALINMWKALANGWIPPEDMSEDEYNIIKQKQDPNDPLTAFAGFGMSFGGRWFLGYSRHYIPRNYWFETVWKKNVAKQAASSLRKKMRTLKDVEWICCDYHDVPTPKGCVIYCDPPYVVGQNSTDHYYNCLDHFKIDEFWDWCWLKHIEGHMVFVSEYEAPDNFEPCFIKHTKSHFKPKEGKTRDRVEKMYVPKGSNYGLSRLEKMLVGTHK